MKKTFGQKLRKARLATKRPKEIHRVDEFGGPAGFISIDRGKKNKPMSQRAAAEMLEVSLRLYEYWEADHPLHVPLKLTQEGALARFANLKPPTK